MARIRNWHKHESRTAVHELQPLSVAFARSYINVIIRDKEGRKMNLLIDDEEAATLATRLMAGINRKKR